MTFTLPGYSYTGPLPCACYTPRYRPGSPGCSVNRASRFRYHILQFVHFLRSIFCSENNYLWISLQWSVRSVVLAFSASGCCQGPHAPRAVALDNHVLRTRGFVQVRAPLASYSFWRAARWRRTRPLIGPFASYFAKNCAGVLVIFTPGRVITSHAASWLHLRTFRTPAAIGIPTRLFGHGVSLLVLTFPLRCFAFYGKMQCSVH
jgi:hypothetical protein